MAFLEDPRLRQRWNQIAHDAETVTENAAAGIWSFQHNYINPCFSSFSSSVAQCTTLCMGDPEERMRRRRERERTQAEYSFDFYDDWYEEENGGLFSNWGNEDWDRLLAGTGTGNQRKHSAGEATEQPKRKRGMSYGTKGSRRKPSSDDPTVIPSTQPIGFLGKLPWKVGGTLRYKPSAADLQDHPQRHGDGEGEPLLLSDDESDTGDLPVTRKRSGTTGSGDTSDSYRSRGDLFPSDGEGEEDAIALDDDVTYDMIRRDDRSSGRSGRGSSKGKRPVGFSGSRTVSRTTLGSATSKDSLYMGYRSSSLAATPDVDDVPTMQDLHQEEHRLREAEDEELARKKEAAVQLAIEKGLASRKLNREAVSEPKPMVAEDEVYEAQADDSTKETANMRPMPGDTRRPTDSQRLLGGAKSPIEPDFIPARLPNFG